MRACIVFGSMCCTIYNANEASCLDTYYVVRTTYIVNSLFEQIFFFLFFPLFKSVFYHMYNNERWAPIQRIFKCERVYSLICLVRFLIRFRGSISFLYSQIKNLIQFCLRNRIKLSAEIIPENVSAHCCWFHTVGVHEVSNLTVSKSTYVPKGKQRAYLFWPKALL